MFDRGKGDRKLCKNIVNRAEEMAQSVLATQGLGFNTRHPYKKLVAPTSNASPEDVEAVVIPAAP